MSTKENLIGMISIDSAVDHSANQFRFVTAAGALAAANGVDAVGVLQDAIDGSVDGPKPMPVGYLGASKVRVDGNAQAIVVGSKITTDANGKGVTKAAFATGDVILGVALEASAADNDIIKVLLTGQDQQN